MMNTIAVFDFDGTITSKDTLFEFIKFVRGRRKLYLGLFLFSPLLIAYKLKIYPNWKIKEQLFSFFFKQTNYKEFRQQGVNFVACINSFIKEEQLKRIREHKKMGHKVYVVTASIEEWVAPWCYLHDIDCVLATNVEQDCRGRLTGKFSSKNCYGIEKVNRFLKVEPERTNYYLYAYGDSAGDREMLALSDSPCWV